MRRLVARLRGLWSREPVLVGSVLPVLVTVGLLTQSQASKVATVAAGIVAVGLQVAAAVKVRSTVTSPASAAKLLQIGLSKFAVSAKAALPTSTVEPQDGPQTPSGVSSANPPAVS